MSGGASWVVSRERGTAAALRAIAWVHRELGPRMCGILLPPIAAYFLLTGTRARRASLDYLRRLYATPGGAACFTGPPGLRHSFRHFLEFSRIILDRISFWAGDHARFRVGSHGHNFLEEELASGRGAVLIGAHLGSFDVLRVMSERSGIRVNVLMYTDNAQRINALFKELDPTSDLRVINIDPHSVSAAFAAKACLDRGEFVALLADRSGLDGRDRVSRVPFLGEGASFPQGPFMLPIVLGVPALLTVAVRSDHDRYELFAEPLFDGRAVPRSERSKVQAELTARYAERLEDFCTRFPYQWFNFFDFWSEESEGEAPRG